MENPLGIGPKQQRDLRMIGAASGIGCSIVVSLGGMIGLGILLDRWLDRSPVFTLVGIALGLIVAGYSLYELAVLSDESKGLIRMRRSRPGGSAGASGEDSTRARGG